MRKFHLVKTYFHKRSPQFSKEWLDYRLSIYRNYTLRSLKRQTFRDFSLWICCEPGLEQSMEPLARDIPDATFTFGNHYPATRVPACDWVYVTRVHSDDLYRYDALGHVNANTPVQSRVEASVFQKGYVYDLNLKAWGLYYNVSPQFHCLMFPRHVFVDEKEYKKNFVGDHSKVRSSYTTKTLPDFKFCMLIHGRNWTSTFESMCKGRIEAIGLDDFI